MQHRRKKIVKLLYYYNFIYGYYALFCSDVVDILRGRGRDPTPVSSVTIYLYYREGRGSTSFKPLRGGITSPPREF